jgi:aspartate aminotransferase
MKSRGYDTLYQISGSFIMNIGKQYIYDLPENDITWLGDYARQLEQEARTIGTPLPPAVRLQIGEPSFRTPEHIRLAAVRSIEQEPLTYAPPAGWPWLRELLAEKIQRINGYTVRPENVTVTLGGTGALQTSLLATVGEDDEVLIPDPGWPLYTIQLAACGAVPVRYPLDPNNE